jgi:hypothetical protein
MTKTLIVTMATLFALSAVALADESPAANTGAPGATEVTAASANTSPIVKHSAKKKKKKKKKHHTGAK